MRIKSVRIENFRSFKDETVGLDPYTCCAGPNGAGKSNILAALNVFFQEKSASSMDTSRLVEEDYFQKQTSTPIRITVVFEDLSDEARSELAAYVRQDQLVVTAEALFDPGTQAGSVRHYGQRLGFESFRHYFDREKAGAKAGELRDLYTALREQHPKLPAAGTKDQNTQALKDHEAAHQEECTLIPSADEFYGVNSTGKLARFVQWIFVPAVKDAGEEGQEGRNTALGRLVARAVRSRVSFDSEIESLKADTLVKYRDLLFKYQDSLEDLAKALQRRLEELAHPSVSLGMEWTADPARSVTIVSPVAGIKTGDGGFVGSLSRMGHGLQRSYLLALLQELADADAPDAPTMILGCEEPELYQHPPQARHLADVFENLVKGNNQVIVTTHSPYFVRGEGFENVRLVRKGGPNVSSTVRGLSFNALCARIRAVRGEDPRRPPNGLIAKLHQALQPQLAEMLFARVVVLVEGLEDVAYVTTALHCSDRWPEFRRRGCHIVPTNSKDRLVSPVAIAKELGLPVFVMFDADGDETKVERRRMHEKDNTTLLALLGSGEPAFPGANVLADDHAVWRTSLTEAVKEDLGDRYDGLVQAARTHFPQEGGLEKQELFIADWLSSAYAEGKGPQVLDSLCGAILKFASAQ